MKKHLYLVWLVVFLATAGARGEVRIREVGLAGYIEQRRSNQVVLEVSNPSPSPQDFILRLHRMGRGVYAQTEHHFRLEGAETRVLTLPVYLDATFDEGSKLGADLIDSSGRSAGSAEKDVTVSRTGLVAVVCNDPKLCAAVSQAIRAGSTIEERNRKERQLKIILLQQPPENWFAYAPVRPVVIAAPVINPKARQAISDYVRLGGHLILAQDQAPDELFAEYRRPGQRKAAIGNGLLTVVARATGYEMQEEFEDKGAPVSPMIIIDRTSLFAGPADTGWLMRWLGTRFEFPRLSWMLVWTGIYITVIGVLNFMLLRRIGKVELGWITVPALALLFGVIFYFFSVRGRMTRFGVDEITICWMDDKSPTAASESRIRVASPQVRDISLQVPREAVLHDVEFDPLFRASDVSDVWSEGRLSGRPGIPDVHVDATQHLSMEMLRLSFRDLAFRAIRQFPGTVHLEQGHLKNSTGQSFSQAVLVDLHSDQYYELGALADRAEVQPFARHAQKLLRGQRFSEGQITPTEVLHAWGFPNHLPERNLVFVGLSDQPLLGSRLEGIEPEHRTYNFVVVNVGRQP